MVRVAVVDVVSNLPNTFAPPLSTLLESVFSYLLGESIGLMRLSDALPR